MSAPQNYRQRYVAFKISQSVSKGKVISIVSEMGREKDFSPPLWLVLYDVEKSEGLIKCGHGQVERLKKEMDDLSCPSFVIMGVSGTIKSARQKFLSVC